MQQAKAQNGTAVRDPYVWIGVTLTVMGSCLSPLFYFVANSVALTGVGISCVMLGLVCVALANTRDPISPEASRVILQAGMENTASLLEELGLNGKAIYLPRSRRGGRSQALVPIKQAGSSINLDKEIPGRLIVRHGNGPDDLGIAIATPGSVCLSGLEVKPGPTPDEIESALSTILVGMLDIASSVSVSTIENGVRVEAAKPKLGYENVWFYQSMGSPLASIAATTTSEAFEKPVVVTRDEIHKGKARIELEIWA